MSVQYVSQHKQDLVLDQVLFANKPAGVFLDIGANDGLTYSNTSFLEQERKWKGICVEPLPDTFEKLKTNRSCILENCAVGAADKQEDFLQVTGYAEMLSGLMKNYNKKHLERVDSEIAQYGGEKRVIVIKTVNINTLLAKHHIERVDYCNIDTEGSELEIIRAIDFSKVAINVFTVEANYRSEVIKMKLFLFFKGYKYITNLGNDMLFVHKRIIPNTNYISAVKAQILQLTKQQ
jgi:FkbM family methyltransferase